MYVLLIIAGFAAFVIFFGKLMTAYANKLTSTFVGDRHRDADLILETGYMPEPWLVDTTGKTPKMKRLPSKQQALRKLQRIMDYFGRTPMIESEEVRKVVLSDLKAISIRWKSAPIEDLIPPSLRDSFT